MTGEGGGERMSELTCAKCGHRAEVSLTDERDGQPISVEEYMAALELADMVLLCDKCAQRDLDQDG